jgi:hypothetical protein
MRRIIVILISLVLSYLYADDTLMAGSGDTLHPIISTDIEMQDEKLNIEFSGVWTVSVDYIFFNYGSPIDVDIAFVSENETNTSSDHRRDGNLTNMKTMANDVPLQTIQIKGNKEDYYSFKMRFAHGKNTLQHTYSIDGKISFDPLSYILKYRLTTGGNWAGGTIGNISIDVTFKVPIFLAAANTFFEKQGDFHEGINSYGKTYWFSRTGKLHFSAKMYKPEEDLVIDISTIGALDHEILIKKPIFSLYDLVNFDLKKSEKRVALLKSLSAEQLAFMRNAIYAWHGYNFKNQDLKNNFLKYGWYIPSSVQISLSEIELSNINLLKQIERENTLK